MSKVIGKPLAVEPSSPPSGAVDRSTRSPTNSASVNPPSMHWVRRAQGQRLDRVDWHDRPCTPHGPPLGPKPPSRIWS